MNGTGLGRWAPSSARAMLWTGIAGAAAWIALSPSVASAQSQVTLQQREFTYSQAGTLSKPLPVVRTSSGALDYYDFRSASSHMGMERPRTGFVFIHYDISDPGAPISLITTYGHDGVYTDPTTGATSTQPTARVNLDITDLPSGVFVSEEDDNASEFSLDGADPTTARGRWRFANNTDGGVISGFPDDEDWQITLDFGTVTGIDEVIYFSEITGEQFLVDTTKPLIISYDAPQTASTYEVEVVAGESLELCAGISSLSNATSSYTWTWDALAMMPAQVSTGTTAGPVETVCDSFTFTQEGDYVVQLAADDGAGQGVSTTVVRVIDPCGDGLIAAGEQCDDGNNVGGDGCSATCQAEFGYQCSVNDTTLANPSFESPAIASDYQNITPDSWTAFGATVDIHRTNANGEGVAVDGSQLVDLSSSDLGGIYQDISTVVGQRYTVTFAGAFNNACSGPGGVAEVQAFDPAESVPHTRKIVSSVQDFNDTANWEDFSFTFEATTTTTRLRFEGLLPVASACGFTIDDLSLEFSDCAPTDDDGDGILTINEDPDGDGDPTNDDTDGDMTPDYLDTDDDDDGTLTIDESVDSDMSGTSDHLEPCVPNANALACGSGDFDMDNLTNAYEQSIGTDPTNADTDGDGVQDDVEVGMDPMNPANTDMDMLIDALDVDDDGDGVLTADETYDGDNDPTNDNTDAGTGDMTPDYLDTDDDGDGKLTADEDVNGNGDFTDDDTDGDMIPDYLDADDNDGPLGDADMDGVLNTLEDADGNGDYTDDNTDSGSGDTTPNWLDPDDDGDGKPTADEDINNNGDFTDDDTDGDMIPDYLDADDNDGPNGDLDMDGLTNGQEMGLGTNPNNPDSDGDGVGDLAEVGDVNNPTNTDGDMLINALDADDDGDGVDSLMEDTNGNGDPSDDVNGDGIASYLDPCDPDSDALACPTGDPDGDGVPNGMDPAPTDPCDPNPNAVACDSGDTDMDGLSNSVEQTLGTNPNNPDTDGDGVRDDVEVGDVNMPTNTDGDMLIDALDADDDGDGIDTADEDLDGDSDPTNDNTDAGDGDTTPNYLDVDDDGDGKLTEDEDINNNGDYGDDDTDGDMIPDYLDADDSDGPLGDVDMDGIPNEDEDVDGDGDWTNDDTDMDMIPDFEDPDDDGDGVPTADEDRDGDGDPTNDNSDEALGDTIPDYLDTDDDGDGVDTRDEDVDMDGDPTNDDTNMDSVPDFLDPCDPDPASAACANGDTDGDGTINSMDPAPLDPCVPNPDALACDSGDTDMDGLPNGTERMLGTDPELQDTDMDGIFDGFEVTDPVAPEDTDMDGDIDALDPDDDGDGVPTLDENADPNGDGNPDDALDSNENGTPDYLDATFPPAPAVGITAPAEGDEVGADFTVTGIANPGDEVAILVDGAEVGTVTADDEGNWSFDVTGLEPGAHTVEANTEGATAGPVTVTVVDDMMMDDEVAITAPADGSEVPADFTVSGTANAGAEVTVTIGDAAVGTATADDDGNWTLDITGQNPGEVTVTATNGDASESVTVTVAEEMGELEVEITSPSAGDDVTLPVTVTGTATPGAEVEITIDGKVIGTTTADEDGNWSIDVDEDLEPGDHDLGVSVKLGDDEVTGDTITITVPDEFDSYYLTGGCNQAPDAPAGAGWLALLGGLAFWRRRRK